MNAEAMPELRHKWGWFVALGVLMLIAGAIAMANLFAATVVSVLYVGALMLIGGIFEIIHAFGVKTWGRFVWWLGSGILYAVAGIEAVAHSWSRRCFTGSISACFLTCPHAHGARSESSAKKVLELEVELVGRRDAEHILVG